MSIYVKVLGPGKRERLVKRSKAIEMIADGAIPVGEHEGYEAIVVQEKLEWRKVTRKHWPDVRIGMAGMSLVRL